MRRWFTISAIHRQTGKRQVVFRGFARSLKDAIRLCRISSYSDYKEES